MTIHDKTDLTVFVAKWSNREAAKYVMEMSEYYGLPDYVKPSVKNYPAGCCWINIAGVDKVEVKDEAIEHSHPAPHMDFVYSTLYLEKKLKASHIGDFASISGSILCDGLKNEVTARCGKILKNAVTLQFVKDVLANKVDAKKSEYTKRIKANKPVIPYKDAMMEYDMEMNAKKLDKSGVDLDKVNKSASLLNSLKGMTGGLDIGY